MTSVHIKPSKGRQNVLASVILIAKKPSDDLSGLNLLARRSGDDQDCTVILAHGPSAVLCPIWKINPLATYG